MGYIQVITTTSSRKNAEEIAGVLVRKKLAACVQVMGPIRSTFRWQAGVARATEWICFVKTKERLYGRVEAAIKSCHEYTVPEIISQKIISGSADYLGWIEKSLK